MKTKIILLILLSFRCFALSDDQTEEEGLKQWTTFINRLSESDPNENDFKNISSGFMNLKSPSRYSSPDRILVYRNLQEAVIKIPDYANIFRDRLIKIYDDRLNTPSESSEYGQMTASVPLATAKIYMTLESLPTKETVFALADLYEYSKFDARPIDDAHNPAEPIPVIAARILNEMPIKNRPYPEIKEGHFSNDNFSNMMEKWRQWCHDVKTGKIEPEFGPEIFADGTIIPPLAERQAARAKKLAPTILQTQEGEHKTFAWLCIAIGILTAGGLAVWKTKGKK